MSQKPSIDGEISFSEFGRIGIAAVEKHLREYSNLELAAIIRMELPSTHHAILELALREVTRRQGFGLDFT